MFIDTSDSTCLTRLDLHVWLNLSLPTYPFPSCQPHAHRQKKNNALSRTHNHTHTTHHTPCGYSSSSHIYARMHPCMYVCIYINNKTQTDTDTDTDTQKHRHTRLFLLPAKPSHEDRLFQSLASHSALQAHDL